jgi:hypothetical protein
MMARLKPPRAAFINFPLGRQCGKPNDVELQKEILRATLNVLKTATAPGEIVTLPYEWEKPFDWSSYTREIMEMLEEEGTPAQEWTPKE